ncbi:MAG: bifunctional alpha/beta hydrolase/class I SAM-dependent methyltransferase [Alphaproteobacteria bacterium]|nr:bifunctional alpha/beta hydrolase/class I SAM-dependent methyltransferase [Alphaproteobacteria bacterium]
MKERKFEECYFRTSDNVELYYKHWPAVQKTDKAVILFHRGHEHSGRLQHIADELNLPNVAMFAWDARGHGRSLGERGYSPSVDRSVADVEEFVKHIAQTYGIPVKNMIVIAQSIGAVSVLAWIHDYAPEIRGVIAASPAFDVKLYVPFARSLIALGQKIMGQFYVSSYVKARFLTHDKERIYSYNHDPLITKQIATNILLELYETSERIVADAAAIKVPLQLFVSGSDFVVHQKAVYDFYDKVGSPHKEKHILEGFYHDTLGEKNRAPVMLKMRQFIEKLYAEPLFKYDYSQEDKTGFSAQKLKELQAPAKCCFKRAYYGLLTWMLHHFGWLSEGMKLGLKEGFDSGPSLDYVYNNKPSGKLLIGKQIDKRYLNNIGWRGVRIRKQQLVETLYRTIYLLQETGKSVRIADIAAGYGRYVFEALDKADGVESVILRDFNEANVVRGQKLITDKGLENIIRFEKGDAFDAASLATIKNKPNLVIISGLYELFAENDLLRASLKGVFDIMEQGGYLIYTNQPWHPQLEIIARVLNSHRQGKAWAMRCRSQAEIDSLAADAGFEKVSQLCSENAIFTVSVARKK